MLPKPPMTSWQFDLEMALKTTARAEARLRLAVLGVGNELRGDDAAGVTVARQLLTDRPTGKDDTFLTLDCGPAPENFTGTLRRFDPDLIIIIDAAEMGQPPGEIRLIELDGHGPLHGSTHALPLWTLSVFLEADLQRPVYVLAIQMGSNGFDEPLTSSVTRSVNAIVETFEAIYDASRP